MKHFFYAAMILVLMAGCTKSGDPVIHHINCDGIVTDTAGTNDQAVIYMPNAFTANNDGLNDTAKPYTSNISSLSFTVYDNNNNVLFTTNQMNDGWPVPARDSGTGYYYYSIQALTAAGHHLGACGNLYSLTCFPRGINHSDWKFEDQLTAFGFTGLTADSLAECQ